MAPARAAPPRGRVAEAARAAPQTPRARASAAGCPRTRARSRSPADQPRARRPARARTRSARCSARTSALKGGVYGVTARPAQALRRRRASSTRCSTSRRSSASRSAPAQLGSCRSPRSSTSPTSTTPRTSCAARRRRCSSSRTGQYRNPMVVRIAGLRLPEGLRRPLPQRQRGRRAARHPGPGDRRRPPRGDDAAAMLRTCVAAARVDGAVCVFLEPIALYHTRDLHEPGDEAGWRRTPRRRGAQRTCRSARARTYGDGADLTLVTFGNGLCMSCASRARLEPDGIAGAGARPALARAAAGRRHRARGRRRPAACWSSTRPAAPAASPRPCSPRSSTRGFTGAIARVTSDGQLHPARRRRQPRPALRRRHRARRARSLRAKIGVRGPASRYSRGAIIPSSRDDLGAIGARRGRRSQGWVVASVRVSSARCCRALLMM